MHYYPLLTSRNDALCFRAKKKRSLAARRCKVSLHEKILLKEDFEYVSADFSGHFTRNTMKILREFQYEAFAVFPED